MNYVLSVKYLGVIFDNDLTWNSHLAYVCKKLRALSCIMYNLRYFMPLSVRKIVLHALGYSVLRYGITLYGHCAARGQQRLNSILSTLLKKGITITGQFDMSTFDPFVFTNYPEMLQACRRRKQTPRCAYA